MCPWIRLLGSGIPTLLAYQLLIIDSRMHWQIHQPPLKSKLPFSFPWSFSILPVVSVLTGFASPCRHVEELIRLPGCFLCYTPSPETGPVVPTPALTNGFVTFGSFNNLAKVTTDVLQTLCFHSDYAFCSKD